MIIKRKKINRYLPNGYDKKEDVEKNGPGFYSTSTSYESYKTFSDEESQNYINGIGLGAGAGFLGGKLLQRKLDKKTFEDEEKLTGKSLEGINKTHDPKIAKIKKQRLEREEPGFLMKILDSIDRGKDKKKDLEEYDKEIKNLEEAKAKEVSEYMKKVDKKLKRNKKIGKGVSIGGAIALSGLGAYGAYKHNQKARIRKEESIKEKDDITSALRQSSDLVSSGKMNPNFKRFIARSKKENNDSTLTKTKESLINSIKAGNTDDLKEKFNKLKNTVASASLVKNIGNGLNSGFSGLEDNIKRNIFGNDK